MALFDCLSKKTLPNPKNIRIVIDAGHGGFDLGLNVKKAGKKTPNKGFNGIMEKNINLEVASRLAWLCSRHSIGYLMTRWGDRFISLSDRVRMANITNSALFLSIHCNYAPNNPKIKGFEVWHYNKSINSKIWAGRILTGLKKSNFSRDRGVKSTNIFYVLKKTKMPAVIVELGFLSNPEDAVWLDNENYQMMLAANIFEAVKKNL